MTDHVSVRTDRDLCDEGYPKLVVRLIPGCYQYRHIPEHLEGHEEMIVWALETSSDLQRSTCLVLGPSNALYCEPDGSRHFSKEPPSGGAIVGANVQFVCADGTVRKESPRGPVVRRVPAEGEGR